MANEGEGNNVAPCSSIKRHIVPGLFFDWITPITVYGSGDRDRQIVKNDHATGKSP